MLMSSSPLQDYQASRAKANSWRKHDSQTAGDWAIHREKPQLMGNGNLVHGPDPPDCADCERAQSPQQLNNKPRRSGAKYFVGRGGAGKRPVSLGYGSSPEGSPPPPFPPPQAGEG